MKLTAEVLIERLQKKMKVSRKKNLEAGAAFGRPLLLGKAEDIRQGRFYVAEAEGIREEVLYKKDICLLLVGHPKEETYPERTPYVCVEPEEGIYELLNEVQEIFDELEDWRERLERICEEKGSMEELLQVSKLVFENPLFLMETDFTLKAEAGQSEVPEEFRVFSGGSLKKELVATIEKDPLYNQMRDSREVFLFPKEVVGFPFYSLNLWEGDNCQYRLVIIEAKKTLTEGDAYLLKYFGAYVCRMAYCEELSPQGEHKSIRTIYRRILTDRSADYREMSRQLAAFGWEPGHQYLCMALRMTYRAPENLTADIVCEYLEKNYAGACSFLYGEDIVTFFNLTIAAASLETLEARLKYYIDESPLRAGYSWVMEGHGNLRRQYLQACIAIDVGSRRDPYKGIHHFSKIAFSYILEQSTGQLPGYMLCHEKLRVLQKIDKKQKTEYMKTLKTYLDERLNAMQSAKKLFIHRSTFLYRLEKIKTILDSELEDPEEILYLSLSFRLLEKEKNTKVSIRKK